MKVIKHLKQQTPDFKLHKFCRETPLLTRVLLPSMFVLSLVVCLMGIDSQSSPFSIIIISNLPEIILFILLAINDVRRQQFKGSIYFLISFLLLSAILWASNYVLSLVVEWPELQLNLNRSSIPIQYIFTIACLQAGLSPNAKKPLFTDPFYLKASVYPIVIIIILELIGLRIDLSVSILLAIILYFVPIMRHVCLVSMKIDQFVGEEAVRLLFVRTGNPQTHKGAVQNIVTTNSIILQEK